MCGLCRLCVTYNKLMQVSHVWKGLRALPRKCDAILMNVQRVPQHEEITLRWRQRQMQSALTARLEAFVRMGSLQ